MSAPLTRLKGLLDTTEEFFDRLKLTYKWRFNRFFSLTVIPYRGFGTAGEVWLRGRVLDDKTPSVGAHESVWSNVTTTLRRIDSDEIPGATVRVRFYDAEVELQTDGDGFFDVRLEPSEVDPSRSWHDVDIELIRPRSGSGEPVTATGQIIIPGDGASFGVISDLDDTVVRSGAQNKLQFGRVVLLNNASTRTPFPGIASFYRALCEGTDQEVRNPVFYVSSSPWNLYTLFDDFLEAHEIPAGPVLLRDYGLTSDHFFSGEHRSHKLKEIERILDTYPELPFVLIGDSGQKDPEIYREVVESRPDRIRAVFIRDVTPPGRDRQVHAIAREVQDMGVPMALVQDSAEAARVGLELGLIKQEFVARVRDATASEDANRKEGRGILDRLRSYLPSFSAS